jgi:hypothetical protein
MLFIAFVQPLVDGLLALILSYFELLKSKIAVGIGNNNKKLEGSSHAIGFHVPDQEEEEDEDDE